MLEIGTEAAPEGILFHPRSQFPEKIFRLRSEVFQELEQAVNLLWRSNAPLAIALPPARKTRQTALCSCIYAGKKTRYYTRYRNHGEETEMIKARDPAEIKEKVGHVHTLS